MVDCSIQIGDLVTEAKYSLRRFGDYVQINSFNSANSEVPHLTVIFSKPPDEETDIRAESVRSIWAFLYNPTMNYSGWQSVDFEPGYENILKQHSLPFTITENQNKVYIKHPTYQPSLAHFGFDTGITQEQFDKEYYRKKEAFDTIKAGLEVRKAGVYKPKEKFPKTQRFFSEKGEKGIAKNISRQTRITRIESKKYYIDERQEDFRVVIPDLIYYVKNLGPIVGEVKPWTTIKKDTLRERNAQLTNYDAMLKYHNDQITPVALVIPETASAAEIYNLSSIQEKTGRQHYVFTISTREYLKRSYNHRKEQLEKLIKTAEGMSAKQLQKFLAIDIEECKEDIRLLDSMKNGFEL